MAMVYEGIARRKGFRFIGNVQLGRDLSPAELSQWYDAVIYAVGADGERRLNIPGENLAGSSSARAFVSWYNGHPDFNSARFDLNTERAILVGNGNVAMDIARILFSTPSSLHATDIAGHALDSLAQSRLKEIVILGRRGAECAAFNYPELAELGDLPDTAISVTGSDINSLPISADRETQLKLETLAKLCREKSQGSRKIDFRFNAAPIEFHGEGKLERVRIADTQQGRSQEITLNAGLAFAAIGYRGLAINGLPFNEGQGIIPNLGSRIIENNAVIPGAYVCGWIRRGPKGIIGSNKKCARDAVAAMMADADNNLLPREGTLSSEQVLELIKVKQPAATDFSNWQAIDRYEQFHGKVLGRPRLKITNREDFTIALRGG